MLGPLCNSSLAMWNDGFAGTHGLHRKTAGWQRANAWRGEGESRTSNENLKACQVNNTIRISFRAHLGESLLVGVPLWRAIAGTPRRTLGAPRSSTGKPTSFTSGVPLGSMAVDSKQTYCESMVCIMYAFPTGFADVPFALFYIDNPINLNILDRPLAFFHLTIFHKCSSLLKFLL